MTTALTLGIHVIKNLESYDDLSQKAKTQEKRLVLVKYKNEYAVRVLPKQGALSRALATLFGTTARQERQLREFAATLPKAGTHQQQVANALGDAIKGEKSKLSIAERSLLVAKHFGLGSESNEVIDAFLRFHDERITDNPTASNLITDAEAFAFYQYNTALKQEILKGASDPNNSAVTETVKACVNHIKRAIEQLTALGLVDAIPLDPEGVDAFSTHNSKTQEPQIKQDPLLQELKTKLHELHPEQAAQTNSVQNPEPLSVQVPVPVTVKRALVEPDRLKAKEAQDVMKEADNLVAAGKLAEAESKALEAVELAEKCEFLGYGLKGPVTDGFRRNLSKIVISQAKAARSQADALVLSGDFSGAEAHILKAVNFMQYAYDLDSNKKGTLLATYLMEAASILEKQVPEYTETNAKIIEAQELRTEAKALLAEAREALGIKAP